MASKLVKFTERGKAGATDTPILLRADRINSVKDFGKDIDGKSITHIEFSNGAIVSVTESAEVVAERIEKALS